MKAITIHQFGGPEVLRIEQVPVPQPGPGEALLKLAAIGVNFLDLYQRSGAGAYRPSLPFIPGSEGAGVVEAVGPDVSEVKVGDRVAYAMVVGAYAEYAVVLANRLAPVPDDVDLKQAAAAMLQGMTAHYLTRSTYPLQPEDACLVHAAAGGVGGLLVQSAKQLGSRVIGTVSSEEKERVAKESGADEVIRYTAVDFASEVRRLTSGRGVSVVYDGVGQATFEKGLDSLSSRGYMVLFGQSSGPVGPVDPQLLNAKGSLFLTRPNLAHYIQTRDELLWRAGEVLAAVGSGTLRVRIAAELPLSAALEAHRVLQGRKTTGKILLIP